MSNPTDNISNQFNQLSLNSYESPNYPPLSNAPNNAPNNNFPPTTNYPPLNTQQNVPPMNPPMNVPPNAPIQQPTLMSNPSDSLPPYPSNTLNVQQPYSSLTPPTQSSLPIQPNQPNQPIHSQPGFPSQPFYPQTGFQAPPPYQAYHTPSDPSAPVLSSQPYYQQGLQQSGLSYNTQSTLPQNVNQQSLYQGSSNYPQMQVSTGIMPQAYPQQQVYGDQISHQTQKSNPYGFIKSKEQQIDPSQIPHPVSSYSKGILTLSTTRGILSNQTTTLPGIKYPPATQRTMIVDEGACSPRFMRSTMQTIPQNASELKNLGLPFGIVVNPLAELKPWDKPNFVHQVDFGEEGPVRCSRCHAYINPFVSFVDNGKNFICNMCGFLNSVPSWYMCGLDGYGRRLDLQQRPELTFGSVDFVANKTFHTKAPKPLTYIFLIDNSISATNQGIITSIVFGLKNIIPDLAKNNPNMRLGFITYSRLLQFYNLKGSKPQVLFGSSINPVLPIPEDQLCITVAELAENLSILDAMVDIAQHTVDTDCNCGGALSAAQELLKQYGGRVLLFASRIPNNGPELIKPRDALKIYGTKSESSLFSSISGYWPLKAKELADLSICVDIFLFPKNTFIESSTFGVMCRTTNGQLSVYSDFDYTKDKHTLITDISRILTRYSGYDAIMRVRCSPGLTVSNYSGNYLKKTDTDMDLPGIDADSSFVVFLTYDGKLEQSQPAYVQSAIVFTDAYGKRLIRVHTMKLEVGDNLSVFKFSDTSSVLTVLTHDLIISLLKSKGEIKGARELMMHKCIEILTKYRKNCSDNRSMQLILPESLKNIPIYLLGLSKSPAFRIGTDVPIDIRNWHIQMLMSSSCDKVMQYCYPDLYCLSNLPEESHDEFGNILIPPRLISSCSHLDKSGIYLVDDGVGFYIWVGKNANPEKIHSIIGIYNDGMVDQLRFVPDKNTELGSRVFDIINELSSGRRHHGTIRVYRDGDIDSYFFSRLIEDRYHSQVSYSEHLCNLHEEISQKLS